MTKKTSIIIVNWNTRSLIPRCVKAVQAHTSFPYEIILVDNGSIDGSPAVMKQLEGDNIRAILFPENRGFAAGCNSGIEKASGDVVCLLNTDVIVTRDWLKKMLACMETTGAGMVGPCTDHAKGKQRYKLWLGMIPPYRRRTEEVSYLSFFCVIISRRVLTRIGGLDERFGLGTYEDDDYCRSAREAGFRLVIDGRTWVRHEAHSTFRANDINERALREKNLILFQEKWAQKSEEKSGGTADP